MTREERNESPTRVLALRLPPERGADRLAGAARRHALRRRPPVPRPGDGGDARRRCGDVSREAPPRRGDHLRTSSRRSISTRARSPDAWGRSTCSATAISTRRAFSVTRRRSSRSIHCSASCARPGARRQTHERRRACSVPAADRADRTRPVARRRRALRRARRLPTRSARSFSARSPPPRLPALVTCSSVHR